MAGAAVNWAIYSLAYFPLPISPWSRPPTAVHRRSWAVRIPLFGWWLRAAESDAMRQSAAARLKRLRYEVPHDWQPRLPFWLRPMLIELGMGAALAGLYLFETQSSALLPDAFRNAVALAAFQPWAHWMFLVHAALLVLMTAATFIDFDEQTIPDTITIPGTLLGLGMATASLSTFLPSLVFWPAAVITTTTMNVPWPWNAAKWSGDAGLWLGLGIWTLWCFALANRRWIMRRGVVKAVQYFFAGLFRNRGWMLLLAMWIAGSFIVVWVWNGAGAPWQGLLSSLVGLGVGGGTVWAVRLVASAAMQQEAMGFGDVTLMAMIGAFVGWQAALAGFFLAPVAAVLIVLVQWALTGEKMVAFGPYLCAGTAITVVFWDRVWNDVLATYFLMGPLLPIVLIGALLAMGAMLVVWRMIKQQLFA